MLTVEQSIVFLDKDCMLWLLCLWAEAKRLGNQKTYKKAHA